MIRETLKENELINSVKVIRDAFKTVAIEFKLNKNNCPTHPSFLTIKQLNELKKKGTRFFGLFLNDLQIGFVAIEKADEDTFFMEKLAVLPEYRHKGYGGQLADYVFEYVKNSGGTTVSIGIIDEHTVLKNWYKTLGFQETGIKKFEHLPFTVCFMEKDI